MKIKNNKINRLAELFYKKAGDMVEVAGTKEGDIIALLRIQEGPYLLCVFASGPKPAMRTDSG